MDIPNAMSFRRNTAPTKPIQTPLQILLHMGFDKHRAEKALAATGNRGAQLAADWLLAHVNDQTLDTSSPREYVLYLCPVGEFLNQLETFWDSSLAKCGPNGVHNSIPHITLVPFFKVLDEYSLQLSRVLDQILEQELETDEANVNLQLELYTSNNFMGTFVSHESSAILKRIVSRFVEEISDIVIADNYQQLDALTTCFPWCVNSTRKFSFLPGAMQSKFLKPGQKPFHMTLAYQFQESAYEALKQIINKTISFEVKKQWEIRLYSRDIRMIGTRVYKVVYSQIPQEPDELELRAGDFIYVPDDSINYSSDAWVKGTSWLTGCSGYFPINYCMLTAEVDAWTLQKTIPLRKASGKLETVTDNKHSTSQNNNRGTVHDDYLVQGTSSKMDEHQKIDDSKTTQIYIMRHGERVDFTFVNWIQQCFTKEGIYERKDLNMPISLPSRERCPDSFVNDCPLTNVGRYEAVLSGEALLNAGVVIKHVYCSPSLRCVQTCDSVLLGLRAKDKIPICLEPALFEWARWYKNVNIPDWMSHEEFANAGYNINVSYEQFMTKSELENVVDETCEEYYNRGYKLMQHLLNYVEKTGDGNILIIAHSSTLDTLSRQLTGNEARTQSQLEELLRKIPYCSLIRLINKDDGWKLDNPPICTLSISVNKMFDWRILLES